MYEGLTPIPDSGFVQRLRIFDSQLHIVFNRPLGKFVVTQPSNIGPRKVALVIQGDENPGGWRQPDNRDLGFLAAADFYRITIKQRIEEGEKYMLDYRDKQEVEAAQTLRDLTKDNKYYLANTYAKAFNMGKGTRPYRHVGVKPKGKVFSPVNN